MLLLEIKEMAKQVLDVNFNLSSNLDPSSIFEALEIRLAFHSHSDKKKYERMRSSWELVVFSLGLDMVICQNL